MKDHPKLHIETSVVAGDVAVVRVNGDMSSNHNLEIIRNAIRRSRQKKVILRLNGHLGANGVGMILDEYTILGSKGGGLALVRPSKDVAEHLAAWPMIGRYDDERSAIASLG